MGKVLELSDDTYHQLTDLALHQQRTLEEMFRLCLTAYKVSYAQRAPQQKVPEAAMVPESASPVVLAYRRTPVQCLTAVVQTICEGPGISR